MAIGRMFKKVSDLISSNIEDILDKAEDPLKMYNYLLNEAEEQAQEQKEAIGEVIKGVKMLEGDVTEAGRDVQKWARRVDLHEDNEQLQREAMEQQINAEKRRDELQAVVREHQSHLEMLKMQQYQLQEKIRDWRSKQKLVEVKVKAARASEGFVSPTTSFDTGRMQRTFDKLEDFADKADADIAAAAAMQELNEAPVTAEEKFQKQEVDDEVSRRLAARRSAKTEQTPV